MTAIDLALIKARAAAASPGPWMVTLNGSILHSGPSTSRLNELLGTYVVASVGAYDLGLPNDADAAFIAAAREDVPALLSVLESAIAIINGLVDPDPCWYDNGGKCQAHGQGKDERCADARAQEFLSQHRATSGSPTSGPAGTDEQIRSAVATAIIQAGYDEGSDDGPSLFEWHHCFDTPACRGATGPCACSGVPYISNQVWRVLGPVIKQVAAVTGSSASGGTTPYPSGGEA